MKKCFLVFGVLFLFIIGSNFSLAQKSITIGIVDIEVIVKEMPEAAQADVQLKELQKKYNDSIVKMQEGFYKKVEQYQKQKTMMPVEQQQKEEDALRAEEQVIVKYRDEKLQEIQSKREDYLEPIRQKVKKAIEIVAKEEGMSFVLDKGTSSTVLYFEEKFDITYKVIDKIKRGMTEKK